MSQKILVTLGPSSLSEEVIKKCEAQDIYVFRINLSHTPLQQVAPTIKKIRQWTDVPICLDSEGAQLRNQNMAGEQTRFELGSEVKIHFSPVVGDTGNISFSPLDVARQFVVGDVISIDFNDVKLTVETVTDDHCMARVAAAGSIGSNKAADVQRDLILEPLTEKDRGAIEIGRDLGISHFALSFTNCRQDVEAMRGLCGGGATIISKIESPSGLANLQDILGAADEILIDRGDLSRKVAIEKIPFIQRRIISMARASSTPVYVATNLLESMIVRSAPTRAELNDVVSTVLMGSNGLVLAAETAIGKHPVRAVEMVRRLIKETEKWTSNTSIAEILGN